MQKEFQSTNSIAILHHHHHHCFSARDYLYEIMSTRLSLPFYCCPVFIAIVNSTCFWIDGTEASNRFTCNNLSGVGASMCCDSKNDPVFDKCINGICAYNFTIGVQGVYDGEQSFWRDSCTDPSWKDPACLAMAPCMRTLCCLRSSISSLTALKKLGKRRGM